MESELTPKTTIFSLMSYLGILCLIPVLLNRKDEFVAFHARQGLVLWIWSIIAIFGLYVPVAGKFFFGASTIAIALYSIVGMLSVLLSKAWKLPLIGNWSESL
ncbi:MAG: hypothetical protein HQ517_08350 [SAR324 cluster bacterium]|nr:hypothetical protein [SAR324 cluster bacterium]